MNILTFSCRHRFASGFVLDAAFRADDGVTALFGPSGSGKSTILALIAGILRPHDGSILFGDRVFVDTVRRRFLPPERRRLGFVSQEDLLFPHLSVRDNLRFGLRRQAARPIAFDRVVEVLDLAGLLEQFPRTLSGGQRRRTALGRAILRGPDLLLLDEPLAGLQDTLKHRILTYVERVTKEWHIPTLFVSHDQGDVRRLAEQVVILDNGRVVESGPIAATFDRTLLGMTSTRPGFVNVLRLDNPRRVGDHWVGNVGEQLFHLPHTPDPESGPLWIEFRPSDIILSHGPVQGLSVRNQLQGIIREMILSTERAHVGVDVGPLLWAETTPEAVRELNLHPNVPVTCLIKTTAVRTRS